MYNYVLYLRAVGRKVLWSSACVCLCVCSHTVTASAQVCVPLGHSIFLISIVHKQVAKELESACHSVARQCELL